MISELKYAEKIEKPKWIKNMGTFNSLPEPFTEVTVNDFIHAMKCKSPRYIEYRQVHGIPGEKVMKEVQILYFSNYAIAIVLPDKWIIKDHKTVYNDPIRYFRIGCEHQYVELTPQEAKKRGIDHFGMCWHVVECPKCGLIERYDSSG